MYLGVLEQKLTKYIRRVSISWRPSSKTMFQQQHEGSLLNNNNKNNFSFAAQVIMEKNKAKRPTMRP